MKKLDRSLFLKELKTAFPQLRSDLNHQDGLLHLEIDVFMRVVSAPGDRDLRRIAKSKFLSILKSLVVAVLSMAWFSACGGGGDQTNPPPPDIRVTISPGGVEVAINQTLLFSATVENSTNQAVTWSLSGAGCSGAACGTIGSDGLYKAPADVPEPPKVTVVATSAADTSKSASAEITIVALQGYLNDLWKYDGADWTWVSGSNTTDQRGTYGTKGVADPANVPGGRCERPVSWRDPKGNLWLFGGVGYGSDGGVGELNDLWKFDGANWTWVSGGTTIMQQGIYGTQGVADPLNVPGARRAPVSWIDSRGRLWLFGGMGLASTNVGGYLNDLWEFDPAASEWTWVFGSNVGWPTDPHYGTKGVADPANIPGGRHSSVTYIDSDDNLWLFGGFGWGTDTQGLLNDLWKFDPTTREWTWVSGDTTVDHLGTYGTKGVPAPSNVPGGKDSATSWIDPQGRFWLFGGTIYGLPVVPRINDLWKFDPLTLEWTWISGSTLNDQPGVYGTKGTASALNVPGARFTAAPWLESGGKLGLFGGWGFDSTGAHGDLNDLWLFNPVTLQWVWVSGSKTVNQAGTYGTKGVADPLNVPGARQHAVSWTDSSGNLWIFGGIGYSDRHGH